MDEWWDSTLVLCGKVGRKEGVGAGCIIVSLKHPVTSTASKHACHSYLVGRVVGGTVGATGWRVRPDVGFIVGALFIRAFVRWGCSKR